LFVWDTEFRVRSWNPAAEKIFGFTPQEALGKHPYDVIVPKEAQPEVNNIWGRLLAGDITAHSINNNITKDGGTIVCQWSNTPLKKADGTVRGVLSMVEDVTARKLAEQASKRAVEALRESEAKYRNLTENLDELIYRANPETFIATYVNNGVERFYGCTIEEFLRDPTVWESTIHPEDKERVFAWFTEARRKMESGGIEYRIIRKDKTVRWVEDHASWEKDQQGNAVSLNGVMYDITERKLAEQASRLALDKIQHQAALLDEADDAIILRDPEYRILYWNKGAERMYGWSSEEVLGKDTRELIYRGNLQEISPLLEKMSKEGRYQGELRQYTKSGKEIIVSIRLSLLKDAEGNPKSIRSIATDITERKKLEEQFLRAQRMESLGTLAGGVAHDLNNVLTPILLAVEVLSESVRDEAGQRMLETLESSAQRGPNIVKQVLSFARGAEGERELIHVREVIKGTIIIIRQTLPKQITVKDEIPKELWTIIGEHTPLQQVLMNLCVNARDAMSGRGTLTIAAQNQVIDEQYAGMHLDAKPGRFVMISVADTGMGIAPTVLDRMFEPFFTTKEWGKGTGLGLSTVHAIVKSHGGFINVYSELGKGPTFRIYLPAGETTVAEPEKQPSEESVVGQGESILVVDDETSILQITRETLEAFGYRVVTASDGAEAIALYASQGKDIAVVVTDMMMPLVDGPRMIRALRRLNPHVKIIPSSGLVSNGQAAMKGDVAVDAFIAKPYTAEKLLKTIHSFLHKDAR